MNQQYWSSRIQGLVPYTPGEQPKDRTFIKLTTNENPDPPTPRIHFSPGAGGHPAGGGSAPAALS